MNVGADALALGKKKQTERMYLPEESCYVDPLSLPPRKCWKQRFGHASLGPGWDHMLKALPLVF